MCKYALHTRTHFRHTATHTLHHTHKDLGREQHTNAHAQPGTSDRVRATGCERHGASNVGAPERRAGPSNGVCAMGVQVMEARAMEV